ncbi:hypothetical protein V8E51_013220 [Hyaloscypha variabilis]
MLYSRLRGLGTSIRVEELLPRRVGRINREAYTYNIFYYILLIIKTKILPLKYYILSLNKKGLVEILKYIIYRRTANRSLIISYTYSELKVNYLRPLLTKYTLKLILLNKKEYTIKEGYLKTKQPIYISTGLRNLSSSRPKTALRKTNHNDEEDDTTSAKFGAMRRPLAREEGLLFRDSRYRHEMLPSLTEKTPLAVSNKGVRRGKGKVGEEGEATRALRRIRERSSSGASIVKAARHRRGGLVEEVEREVGSLNMRD